MTLPDSDTTPAATDRRRSLVIGALIVVIAIAAAVWLWLAADEDSAGPEEGVTVEDVSEDRFTDFLVGTEVTISGEVEAFLLPGQAFWIGGGGIAQESVLVVTSQPVEGLEEGTVVQATGVVADFDTVDVLDELDADEDLGVEFGPYEDQNVLADANVDVLEGS